MSKHKTPIENGPKEPQYLQRNAPLAPYTSWLIGGLAEYLSLPKTLENLQLTLAWAQAKQLPITILGGGTNVLVSDRGVAGLTICLKNFAEIEVEETSERIFVRCLSGTSKSELLKTFLKFQLAPALFLAGLPGDVGGGVAMNAGVAEGFVPREFGELVDWIEVLKDGGQIQRFEAKDIHWSYRHSQGWQPGIISQVQVSWPFVPNPTILDEVKAANRLRLLKQPLDMPSCGSVFMNPPGQKAAVLIESCGLKGYAIGDAEVSKKHANFIVNKGRAKASEIRQVIEQVQATVLHKTGVQLKTEVVFLGRW